MSGNKTVPTNASVTAFLMEVEDEVKRKDGFTLMDLMQGITGETPVMWGSAIVGFGSYHYRYNSGREGDMLLVGFSPRKGKLALYLGADLFQNKPLYEKLGKYSSGKSCLYISRLEDVNMEILGRIISNSYDHLYKNYHPKS
jgi:hypothetical protein